MDIFSWSMPFLIEKIAEILSTILSSRPGEITPQPDRLSEQRVSSFKAAFDEFRNENL